MSRTTLVWLLAIIPPLVLLLHAYQFDYVVDDAFISYRYARNLVEGHGLVFNPGERVEGYTNFLWVMLAAASLAMGVDPILSTRVAGLLAAGATLLICLREGRLRYPERPLPALAAPVLLALNGAFALWSQAGLETPLFTLLVTAGVLAHGREIGRETEEAEVDSRRLSLWPVWLGLATLTRPEGALFFSLCLLLSLVILLRTRRRDSFTRRARFLALALLLYSALVLPHLLWRFSYYGEWLPNTFYAKTGTSLSLLGRGLVYLWDSLTAFGSVLLLLPVVLLWRGGRGRHLSLAVSILGYGSYVIWVGGDALAMFRFLVPVLPLLYLLIQEAVCVLEGSSPRVRRSVILWGATLLVLGGWNLHTSLGSPARDFVEEDRRRVSGHWSNIGRFLGEFARPSDTVAVTTAGAIPYYSRLHTIDMLGITDSHIARREMPSVGEGKAGHEKYDVEYVLKRRPTYILHHEFILQRPVIDESQFETPWNPGLRELLDSPAFHRLYRPLPVMLGPGRYFCFFVLRPEYGGPPDPGSSHGGRGPGGPGDAGPALEH